MDTLTITSLEPTESFENVGNEREAEESKTIALMTMSSSGGSKSIRLLIFSILNKANHL